MQTIQKSMVEVANYVRQLRKDLPKGGYLTAKDDVALYDEDLKETLCVLFWLFEHTDDDLEICKGE